MWDTTTSTDSGYFSSPHVPTVPSAIAGFEKSLSEESSLPALLLWLKVQSFCCTEKQGVFHFVSSSLLFSIVCVVPHWCGTEMSSQYNVVVTKALGAIQ